VVEQKQKGQMPRVLSLKRDDQSKRANSPRRKKAGAASIKGAKSTENREKGSRQGGDAKEEGWRGRKTKSQIIHAIGCCRSPGRRVFRKGWEQNTNHARVAEKKMNGKKKYSKVPRARPDSWEAADHNAGRIKFRVVVLCGRFFREREVLKGAKKALSGPTPTDDRLQPGARPAPSSGKTGEKKEEELKTQKRRGKISRGGGRKEKGSCLSKLGLRGKEAQLLRKNIPPDAEVPIGVFKAPWKGKNLGRLQH